MKIKNTIHLEPLQKRKFYCHCSTCPHRIDVMAFTRVDAAKRIRAAGWSITKSGAVCDKCKSAPADTKEKLS